MNVMLMKIPITLLLALLAPMLSAQEGDSAKAPTPDAKVTALQAEITALRAQLAEAQQAIAICQSPGVIEVKAASIAAQRKACEVSGGTFQQGQTGLVCTPKPEPAKPSK